VARAFQSADVRLNLVFFLTGRFYHGHVKAPRFFILLSVFVRADSEHCVIPNKARVTETPRAAIVIFYHGTRVLVLLHCYIVRTRVTLSAYGTILRRLLRTTLCDMCYIERSTRRFVSRSIRPIDPIEMDRGGQRWARDFLLSTFDPDRHSAKFPRSTYDSCGCDAPNVFCIHATAYKIAAPLSCHVPRIE
jgi:hypothetical protein